MQFNFKDIKSQLTKDELILKPLPCYCYIDIQKIQLPTKYEFIKSMLKQMQKTTIKNKQLDTQQYGAFCEDIKKEVPCYKKTLDKLEVYAPVAVNELKVESTKVDIKLKDCI